ncbi:MAG: nuclear transport factor 2 family protein [Cyanobacteria bacterium J06638_38]
MKQDRVIPQGTDIDIDAEWVWNYFRDVDSLNPQRVTQHYQQDGTFRFANHPPVQGLKEIETLLTNFYRQIQSMEHINTGLWLGNNSAVFEAEVIFVRHDGAKVEIPAISIIRRQEALIKSFMFVMDASPLQNN